MVYVDALVAHPSTAYRGDRQAARVGARNGHRWCHLFADTEPELHAFAARIGMQRTWAQVSGNGVPHYDLTPGRRTLAVQAGAVELSRLGLRVLLKKLRAPRPPGSESSAGGES